MIINYKKSENLQKLRLCFYGNAPRHRDIRVVFSTFSQLSMSIQYPNNLQWDTEINKKFILFIFKTYKFLSLFLKIFH